MGDLKDSENTDKPEASNKRWKRTHGRKWIFFDSAQKGVKYSLILALAIFALYTGGSIPDPGFSDHVLFFLLRLLQIVSLLLCACSLIAMSLSVQRLVYRPGWRNGLRLLFYFLAGLLGAGLSMLHSLMFAATGGIG